MKSEIILRDYQEKAIELGEWSVKKFNNNSLICLPTGAGKSLVIGGLADRLQREILVLQPSKEILEQNMKKLANYVPEDEIGVYSASFKRKDINKYTFATIQSIYKVPELFKHIGLCLVDECFTGETEVLTDRGFVRFDSLDKTEKIAQWEQEVISFVSPLRYIEREHVGEIGSLEIYRGIKVPITLGHNQPLVSRLSGEVVSRPISECSFSYGWKLPVSGKCDVIDNPLTALERLYIATQADGNIHSNNVDCVVVAFSFSKERKIERLKLLCKEANVDLREGKDRKGIGNVKTRRRFMVRLPLGTTKDIRNHIKFPMSFSKALQVIEEMVQWDGHIQKSGTGYYYSSTDKSQTDFYASVATLAGCSSYQSTQEDFRSIKFNTVHRLYLHKNTLTKDSQCLSLSKNYYEGKVYCVEVPSNKIVVRHKGYTWITGNCHSVNQKNEDGMFTSFLREIGNPITIGLTASPFRNVVASTRLDDGSFLRTTMLKLINRMNPRLWNRIILNVNNHELVEQGYLVPLTYECRNFVEHDKIPINKSRSEFNLEAFEKLLSPFEGQIIQAINETRKERKAVLVFCSSVNQAERLSQTITKSACVSGLTPIKERDEIIEGFRTGRYQVVFNVGVLTTGFDFPELDCIYLIRPTKSLGLYYQMLGRGVRIAEGKTDCLVVDYSGTVKELGKIEDIKLLKEDGKWELYANNQKMHNTPLFSFIQRPANQAPKSGLKFGGKRF